jgi:uncharacterized glyoxalase superfamily protein PhnB
MDFLFVWIIKLLHVDSLLVIVEKAKIKDRTEDNALQVHLGNLLKQKSTVTFAFSVSTLQLDDSMVEIGDSNEPMPMNLHMYVDDVDGLYRRAITAGGTSVREPETTFYGDRSAGVKDPGGNNWWLACHVEDVSPEEIRRRAKSR